MYLTFFYSNGIFHGQSWKVSSKLLPVYKQLTTSSAANKQGETGINSRPKVIFPFISSQNPFDKNPVVFCEWSYHTSYVLQSSIYFTKLVKDLSIVGLTFQNAASFLLIFSSEYKLSFGFEMSEQSKNGSPAVFTIKLY